MLLNCKKFTKEKKRGFSKENKKVILYFYKQEISKERNTHRKRPFKDQPLWTFQAPAWEGPFAVYTLS